MDLKINNRNFKICGEYRWEITDKYGYSLSNDFIRDSKINNILDISNEKDLDVSYQIGLRRTEDGWGLYQISFKSKDQKLKLYPLADGDIRVDLPCKTLQDCEYLVKLLCKGNNMEVQPAYISSFYN
jgi:hypothetical protein